MWYSLVGSYKIIKKLHIYCANYLKKEYEFYFYDACLIVFEELKKKLVADPIITKLD